VAVHNAEEFGLKGRRVAVRLTQLAQGYDGQGKYYVEVDPVHLQALKIYQTVHTNFTPMSLPRSTTWGLPSNLRSVCPGGPLLTRALAIKEKLLGLDHPDMALSVGNLAQLRVVQGQPGKAEPLYCRTLAIRKRALEPSHLARTIHEYLLRRPILSPGGAFLVRPPRRTASTPPSALLARSPGGLRSRTPRDGIHE
jgi:hypothetical protein